MNGYYYLVNMIFLILVIFTMMFVYWVIYVLYYLIIKEFLGNLFSKKPLNELKIPSSGSNILLFVPHPDDEIISCYSLIKKAKENGCTVKVIVVTNGDGAGLLDSIKYKFIKPEPKFFESMAYLRQKELIKSLLLMGLQEDDIIFLGYPDGCLMHLWHQNWSEHNPLISKYTNRNYSFYENSFNSKKLYTGSFLAEAIEQIIVKNNPNYIIYPNMFDRHQDHMAVYNLVRYVIFKLQLNIIELTYLIHRGVWPVPIGKFKKSFLAPPKSLADCKIKWYYLILSEDEVIEKEKCLFVYKSQLKNYIMRFFLYSFVRKNELYAECPGHIAYFKENSVISSDKPFLDVFLGYVNKSANITNITVYWNYEYINIIIKTEKKPKLNYKYILDVFFFYNNTTVSFILSIENGQISTIIPREGFMSDLPEELKINFGDNIDISFRYKDFKNCRGLLINVLSYKKDKLIDRAGLNLIKQVS